MILRVVGGRIPPGALDAVVESYRRDFLPVAAATPGLDRFVVAVRPASDGGHELASMTIWTSVEAALAAYGGNLASIRTIDFRGHGETLSRVDYYEIDAAGARRRAGSPTRLRLTAGTVARGIDADIQKELRRRVQELPSDALEAFVGRRVLGAEVEIAFMSTWTGEPAGRSLEQPLWPEISERYDSFRIAAHDIILEGSGAS